jgi:holo-[acyl-carrier protein] synthase
MDNKEFTSPSARAGLPDWALMAGLTVADSLDGVVQCGVDLVDIDRIAVAVERWGERFLNRVWTERELAICQGRMPVLAARFAGKEAASKALGTGITGLVWREIEILRDNRGKPLVMLHGKAKERAAELGLNHWSVSLTHSRDLACAIVVAYAHG